ncbi:hypothetical protein SEA_LILPHARAOH_51 [Mycobacterium phage LilPharaoh]|uniref:Uncharacterized protein n=1 Tax=Mycobacterium phage Amelie TaxID=1913035 RepID=A0A1J0GQB5_9CAUD|nr:hypothetical protein AVV01_gp53 [Mycobacterium phage Enkosi]YP_009952569.1 hypothetical protein I5G92_gp51 [Mycobacterium phage Amelie]ATN90504.1 hypothetical protein SEA_LILPHARAOH_51 [Mycobacterium phage LilPharaoh]AVP42628.1 hypothetical protein SEA_SGTBEANSPROUT_51 [Mycobacterium phage SgtBeansprout]AXC37157.1 hypothetical protein SEA_BIGLEBOPS_51 [Mycobacterium phage Biglebops]QGJ93336.1 hypothetical protein PBI_MDAVU_52 [Mycobacterium phage Mdavu]UQS94451.1 hypothetical protein SEA_N
MRRPAPWRIRQLVEGTVVVGWVVEQLTLYTITPDVIEGDYVVVDYFPSGQAAIAAFAEYGESAA